MLARGTSHWVAAPALAGLLLLALSVVGSAGERLFVGVALLLAAAVFFFLRIDTSRAAELWMAEPGVVAPVGFAGLAVLVPGAAAPGGLFLLLLALFMANFFRDPERPLAEGLVSPADGRVQRVEEAEDGGRIVAIFMNVHDVHVNRAPCEGTVVRRVHEAGALLPAWHKDSDRNERVVWDLDTPHGPVRVVQIAGLLARRIVPYVEQGARVRKGERLGIIRLGSRVDVHLPPGCEPAVRVGERVRAGSTTLARPGKP